MKRNIFAIFVTSLILTWFPVYAQDMTKYTFNQTLEPHGQDTVLSWKSDKNMLAGKINNGEINIVRDDMSGLEQIFEVSNLSDLEEHTDCIVKGAFYGDSREDLQLGSQDQVYFGNTITSFKIIEVYKGDLKPGDSIEIVEPYYIDKEGNLQIQFNGLPSLKEQEYLLFLCKDKVHGRFEGMYGSLLYETGRYPVIDANTRTLSTGNIPTEKLGIDHEAKREYVDFYKMMYEAVIKKYMY